jgi:hypothetical protein
VETWIKEGRFATIVSCEEEFSEAVGLKVLYKRMQQFGTCAVFWHFNPRTP